MIVAPDRRAGCGDLSARLKPGPSTSVGKTGLPSLRDSVGMLTYPGLTPQAVFCCPFGAEERVRENPHSKFRKGGKLGG